MKFFVSRGRRDVSRSSAWALALMLCLVSLQPAAAIDVAAKAGGDEDTIAAASAAVAQPRDYHIAVLGDSLGEGVYAGLAQLVRSEANVAVTKYARVNTGIARSDRYDWPEAAGKLADRAMDAALLVFGANDLQTIRENGKAYHYKQDAWEERYRTRVAKIVKAFSDKGIKVYWLSLPITRKNRFQEDYAYLNQIFREVAEANGATFIDAWGAFAGADGDYSETYTLDGSSKIIRASDGVHFTPLGYQVYAGIALDALRKDLNF